MLLSYYSLAVYAKKSICNISVGASFFVPFVYEFFDVFLAMRTRKTTIHHVTNTAILMTLAIALFKIFNAHFIPPLCFIVKLQPANSKSGAVVV